MILGSDFSTTGGLKNYMRASFSMIGSRGSRTDLWGTGGEIPPVYPAMNQKYLKWSIGQIIKIHLINGSKLFL